MLPRLGSQRQIIAALGRCLPIHYCFFPKARSQLHMQVNCLDIKIIVYSDSHLSIQHRYGTLSQGMSLGISYFKINSSKAVLS